MLFGCHIVDFNLERENIHFFFLVPFSISAFVTKLVLREDIFLENVNISPKSERENQTSSLYGGCHVGGGQEFWAKDVNNRGILMIRQKTD